MATETVARYEFKYAVHADILAPLRESLARYCQLDGASNAGNYVIDTLYFDTPDERFFLDSDSGASVRLKLRVRTYPGDPRSVAKIEVKRRIGELVTKVSCVVPGAEWVPAITRSVDPPGGGDSSLEMFRGYAAALRARPRMLIRYARQAFHSRMDDYVRVTFDQRMQYQSTRHYSLMAEQVRWASLDGNSTFGGPGYSLMEVKFKYRAPVWLRDLIRGFNLTRIGCSKYGTAVRLEKAGLLTAWDLVPALGRKEIRH